MLSLACEAPIRAVGDGSVPCTRITLCPSCISAFLCPPPSSSSIPAMKKGTPWKPWVRFQKRIEFGNNVHAAMGTSGKEPTRQCMRCKRRRFTLWVGKIPWRRKWQPTPVFLPGESHGKRSLVSYSPWGHKESDTTEAT